MVEPYVHFEVLSACIAVLPDMTLKVWIDGIFERLDMCLQIDPIKSAQSNTTFNHNR